MKRIMVIAGQGGQSYGEKLTFRQMESIFSGRPIEFVIPRTLKEAALEIPAIDGVVFTGRIVHGIFDGISVLDIALEFEKPVFFFGMSLGDMRSADLGRFSLVLMSPLVSGFLTDSVSSRWASFWAGKKIETGVDLANIYLIDHAVQEKSKYAVFAPQANGTLQYYSEYRWLSKTDTRIIVAAPEDSRAAVKVARSAKTDDVIIMSEIDDIISAISNAKFVLSERFYVSLTALSFGIPFVHVGRRAKRYFGKNYSDNFADADEIGVALAFSGLSMERAELDGSEKERIYSKFRIMMDAFEKFLLRL